MNKSPQQKVAWSIAIVSLVVPVIVMFLNPALGGILLFIGVIVASRAIHFGGARDDEFGAISDAALRQIGRHQGNTGRTIFVQLVDDLEHELPPEVAQKLMREAQAKADPRDMVVGVRYKLSEKDKSPGA